MEKEEWKDIYGYECLYQISSHGRVKSLNRVIETSRGCRTISEKILKSNPNSDKYLQVGLCKNGKQKTFAIHRLVAEHYIENPNELPEINHIKGKNNNYYKSLEWISHIDNINHAWDSGLCENIRKRASSTGASVGKKYRSKRIYCKELDIEFESCNAAAKKLNLDCGSLSKCCNGKRNYVGRHSITKKKLTWKYI
jgi:hypothetical protein